MWAWRMRAGGAVTCAQLCLIQPIGFFASSSADLEARNGECGYTEGSKRYRECRGRKNVLTINVGVLLAVIVLLRLRRRTESRSRNDEKLTVIIVLALGIVIAPTPLGEGIGDFLGQLASGVTDSSR